MTQYARGRRKEWDVCKRLRAAGWQATRSAGSHGLWDVVAVKTDQPVKLIQVKYTGASGNRWEDDNSDKLLKLRPGGPVDVEVWVYRKGVAHPTVWTPTYNFGGAAVWAAEWSL